MKLSNSKRFFFFPEIFGVSDVDDNDLVKEIRDLTIQVSNDKDLIKLLDEYPSYITIEETKRIIDQLQNCICQVYISNGGKGTGFFCNIKHKDYNKYI